MKTCLVCSKTYNALEESRRGGTMSFGGLVLMMCQCDCGETGAVVLVPAPEDVRAAIGLSEDGTDPDDEDRPIDLGDVHVLRDPTYHLTRRGREALAELGFSVGLTPG